MEARGSRRVALAAALLSGALALVACSGGASETPAPVPGPASETSAAPASPTPTSSPTPSPTPSPTAAPFDQAAVLETITHLAGYGPREGSGPAYREAAQWVGDRFTDHGYTVQTQEFPVPAGRSWGIEVPAGTSHNVIADPPGFDATAPHLIIGAHLDTVPQSPGAEDNASGVAVLLELSRMLAEQPAAVPVRFIAFGAEEPRGSGDSLHHFGSQHYVARLDGSARSAIVAMVSLDRVGVPGAAVPVGTGGTGTGTIRDELVTAAGDIPVTVREPNRSSDHWSFEKAGIPAARLGSLPYAGYHSARDTPDVVAGDQLAAVGAIMWNWLRAQPA